MTDSSLTNSLTKEQPRSLFSPFTRFLAAAGLANMGDGIATVLWAWVASLLTRDPLWIAVLPIALRLPWVLCALPAGLLVDRLDRHRLILRCDLVRALAYLTVSCAVISTWPFDAAAAQGITHLGLYSQLFVLALIIGTCEVIRDTAAPSLLPRLVPDNDLEGANGKIYALETVGNNLAGPALGAMLIAVFLPLPFAVIAALFLASAWLMRGLAPQLSAASQSSQNGLRTDLAEAFRFVLNHKGLRLLIMMSGAWCFFVEMGMIALILHFQDNFGASSQIYGITLAVGALGGVAGGYITAPLLARFNTSTVIRLSNVFDGAGFLIIAFAPSIWMIAAVLFIFHFTGVMWMTTVMTYRQREIPQAQFGRVNAISRLVAFGAIPLGMLASGLIVSITKELLPYDKALITPFVIAGLGLIAQVALSWRAIGQRFPV